MCFRNSQISPDLNLLQILMQIQKGLEKMTV